MRTHRSIGLLVGVALAAVASTAKAQSTTPTVSDTHDSNGWSYFFQDDPMQAGGMSLTAPRIAIVTHSNRAALLRPRAAFVVEMLKSVEAL
jgi:hypothetical protein